VLFYPPSDGSYTLSILADFESPEITGASVESFWTERHPRILASAAYYMFVKMRFKNESEELRVLRGINEDIKALNKANVHEEIAIADSIMELYG